MGIYVTLDIAVGILSLINFTIYLSWLQGITFNMVDTVRW